MMKRDLGAEEELQHDDFFDPDPAFEQEEKNRIERAMNRARQDIPHDAVGTMGDLIPEDSFGFSDSSYSSYMKDNASSEHSYLERPKKGRKKSDDELHRVRKRRSERLRNNGGNEINYARHNNNEGVEVEEEMDKEFRRERYMNVETTDLNLQKMLMGIRVEVDENELRRLRELEKKFENNMRNRHNQKNNDDDYGDDGDDMDHDGNDDDAHRNNLQNIINSLDEICIERDNASENSSNLSVNLEDKLHKDCKLCKFAGMSAEDQERHGRTKDSVKLLHEMDHQLCGQITDLKLFMDMADVFNMKQKQVAQRGGRPYFISVAEVKTHFLNHENVNPLRTLNQLIGYLKEAVTKATTFFFGTTADGTSVFNVKKMQVFLQMSRELRSVNREFYTLREAMRKNRPMRGSGGESSNGQRFLNGPSANGRYNTGYVGRQRSQ